MYPVSQSTPKGLLLDGSGRVYVSIPDSGNVAAVWSVSEKDTSAALTLDGVFPYSFGYGWNGVAACRNTSGSVPVTALFVPAQTDISCLTLLNDNYTQWVGNSEILQSAKYPELLNPVDFAHNDYPWVEIGWSFYVTAVDHQLALLYAITVPCNTVIQYAITVTESLTSLTQSVVITGANPLLNQPIALAIDSSSLLYVADSSNRVVLFDSDGIQLAVLIGPRAGFVSYPQFTIDPNTGDLLIVDTKFNVVRRWSRDGSRQTSFQLPYNQQVTGVAVSSLGHMFVSDGTMSAIVVIPADQTAPLPVTAVSSSSSTGSSVALPIASSTAPLIASSSPPSSSSLSSSAPSASSSSAPSTQKQSVDNHGSALCSFSLLLSAVLCLTPVLFSVY